MLELCVRYVCLTGLSECTNCEAGKYDISGGGASTCSDCGQGKYSTSVAATSASTCIDCVAGKYATTTANTAESFCISCAAGTFALESDVGATTAGVCNDCGTGYHSNSATAGGAGQTEADHWVICYCDGGYVRWCLLANTCDACVAGKYSDGNSAANNACIDCPSGFYEPSTTSTVCNSCPAGNWMDKAFTAQVDATNCADCASPGFTSDAGTSSDDDVARCCAAGYYYNAGGSGTDQCLACPNGKTSLWQGMLLVH